VLAFQKDMDSARLLLEAADRRWIPEPEVLAGTKSSSAGGGDVGSIFAIQAVLPLFDRGQPQRALAQARAIGVMELRRTTLRDRRRRREHRRQWKRRELALKNMVMERAQVARRRRSNSNADATHLARRARCADAAVASRRLS
jgi:hypothetical protein